MLRTKVIPVVLLLSMCVVFAGCMPKMTLEEMKADMPKRPAELDRLNDFVGKWQFEGEMTMAMLVEEDQPLKMSGHNEAKWEGDGWYLVSRGVMNMEPFGETQAIETWSYDAGSKKYRSSWVDSMGMIGYGEGTYDEKTKTWHMKATSYSAWGQSSMKGWAKFTGPDTMEWGWCEYMGLMKTLDMKGTSKRVK